MPYAYTIPAPIGATIYVLTRADGQIHEVTVDSYHLFGGNRDTVETVQITRRGEKILKRWKLRQWGRNLFSTREEAQIAYKLQR